MRPNSRPKRKRIGNDIDLNDAYADLVYVCRVQCCLNDFHVILG